jgi:hypothetical protein
MFQTVEVYNNTFVSSAKCFAGGSTTTGSNPNVLHIKNNVFWRTANMENLNAVVTNPQLFADSGRTIEMDYNVYWTSYPDPATTNFFNTNNSSAYKTFAQWRAAYPTIDVNSVVANPLFPNVAGAPSTWNVFPSAGSPLIGEGINLTAFFSNDYLNATRPASGAWDIGAYDTATPPPSDTTAPTLVSAAVDPEGDTVILTFSEPVQNINLAHYAISGHSLSSLTGSGTTWGFTISPIRQSGANFSMTYTSGAGRTADIAGNLFASGTYTVVNGSLAATPDPPKPGRRGGGAKRLLRR